MCSSLLAAYALMRKSVGEKKKEWWIKSASNNSHTYTKMKEVMCHTSLEEENVVLMMCKEKKTINS